MDDKNCAETIRNCAQIVREKHNLQNMSDALMEAADEMKKKDAGLYIIRAQLAEKDKQLADAKTQHRVEYCESTGYDCEVRGQLEAAMEDLRGLCWCCANGEKWEKAPAWSNMTTCKHIRERGALAVGGGKAGKDCPHWKWRGPKEAGR